MRYQACEVIYFQVPVEAQERTRPLWKGEDWQRAPSLSNLFKQSSSAIGNLPRDLWTWIPGIPDVVTPCRGLPRYRVPEWTHFACSAENVKANWQANSILFWMTDFSLGLHSWRTLSMILRTPSCKSTILKDLNKLKFPVHSGILLGLVLIVAQVLNLSWTASRLSLSPCDCQSEV